MIVQVTRHIMLSIKFRFKDILKLKNITLKM